MSGMCKLNSHNPNILIENTQVDNMLGSREEDF
jgi:hypothetical protein